MKPCVYLTIYRGSLLPPFYIGFGSVERIRAGYHGSASSKEYVKTWKSELKANPHLFVTHVIKVFETRNEAAAYEAFIQRKLNAVRNPLYINRSIYPWIESDHDRGAFGRGKTYEEIYGPEKAAELKAARSAKMKETRKNVPKERYRGRIISQATIDKIKATKDARGAHKGGRPKGSKDKVKRAPRTRRRLPISLEG